MKRTKTTVKIENYPQQFHSILKDAAVYDSSCSPQAKVLFIDKDGGYYLKRSAKGSLETEALLTAFLNAKGLATEVLDYQSLEEDWLMTSRMPGEDCTFTAYLADPERLCDILAEQLHLLHGIDPAGCPVNHTERYLKVSEENYRNGRFDPSYSLPGLQFKDADDAWNYIQRNCHLLKANTLLHGDYCLPNIMLNQWRFSGFIDLGNGGIGDRHVDLFWGAWTLQYNLKTDRYRDRFFDAYGRDKIQPEVLNLISAIEVFG